MNTEEKKEDLYGHTFTDRDGEFVFGPLCPDKKYAVQIWVNDTKQIKICEKCHHEGKCLKGKDIDCGCFMDKIEPRTADETIEE